MRQVRLVQSQGAVCWQGQGAIIVRSARRHLVTATVPHVGVGDIYVIAGQSNASGRGKHLNHATNPVLKAGLFRNDDRWGPLMDPTDGAAGQVDEVSSDPDAAGSIWPLLANRLMRREAVPVAFVPCSTGATPLSAWVRDHAPAPWSSKTLFGSMLRRVHAVGGRVRAVLFWQGERDARSLVRRSDYAAGLAGLAADVRLVTGGPLVPAQIGDVPLNVWAVAGVDAIRMAQEDVLLAPQPAGGLVPGPVLYDIDLAPGWHPETDAQSAAVADRWTAAIRTGVLGADSARPPVLLAAAYDGATTVTVTFRVDGGSLVAGAAGGFALRANGASLALTGAARLVSSDRVEFHSAEPIPSESWARLSLSLGSGRDGAGARVPKEESSLLASAGLAVRRRARRGSPGGRDSRVLTSRPPAREGGRRPVARPERATVDWPAEARRTAVESLRSHRGSSRASHAPRRRRSIRMKHGGDAVGAQDPHSHG